MILHTVYVVTGFSFSFQLHIICLLQFFFLPLSPLEEIINARCLPPCLEQRKCSINVSNLLLPPPLLLLLYKICISISEFKYNFKDVIYFFFRGQCPRRGLPMFDSASFPHSHKDPFVVLYIITPCKTSMASDLDGHSSHNNK